MSMPGGVGDVKAPDAETQEVFNKVMPALAEKFGVEAKDTSFEIVHYRSQVVAGRNYFFKVKVNHPEQPRHAHVRVFLNLQQNATVSAVIDNLTADTPLEFFTA